MSTEFLRIGDKIVDKKKAFRAVDRILTARAAGSSQQEAADKVGVDRSFVSRLEALGEIRRGGKIALVGFPVANKAEIEKAAREEGIDFVLVFTDEERWAFVNRPSGADLFHDLLRIVYEVRSCDVVLLLGSDKRLEILAELVQDKTVIPISLGSSPMTRDAHVDPRVIRDMVDRVRSS